MQDLASRYPAAKVVSSSKASNVIPALEQIYDAYVNPVKQLSDNGSPFNSKEMDTFAKERNVTLEKTPSTSAPICKSCRSLHEISWKPMKIAAYNHVPEKKALSQLSSNYLDTPHPSTCIAPAAMMFGDSHQTTFPRMPVSGEAVKLAREQDLNTKHSTEEKIKASKYHVSSDFKKGDNVLLRNFAKSSNFHPKFQPEPYEIL